MTTSLVYNGDSRHGYIRIEIYVRRILRKVCDLDVPFVFSGLSDCRMGIGGHWLAWNPHISSATTFAVATSSMNVIILLAIALLASVTGLAAAFRDSGCRQN